MVKSTGCSCGDLELNIQQSYSGSHPPIVRSDDLFWHKGIYADRVFYA